MKNTPAKPVKRPRDFTQFAKFVIDVASGEVPNPKDAPDTRNPAAVALGKLGGAKGGNARAAKLTPRRRKQIAKKAAVARWAKKKED